METNAIGVACVEPECFDFGWSTLIAKESEWKAYHANLQTQANKRNAIIAALVLDPLIDVDSVAYSIVRTTASTIPALPTFPNPGRFKILDIWTDKQRSIEKIQYDQKMEQYLTSQHVDKALVMLFKEIFDESLCADLNKGATIGSSALRNLHTARQIREHLERKFDKERPLDVEAVELEFKTSIDTALPLENTLNVNSYVKISPRIPRNQSARSA